MYVHSSPGSLSELIRREKENSKNYLLYKLNKFCAKIMDVF